MCADSSATLFVGGLTDKLTEEDLRGMFSLYGDLVSVKCLTAKGCAFVQYTNAAAAKAAMTMLQDQVSLISHIRQFSRLFAKGSGYLNASGKPFLHHSTLSGAPGTAMPLDIQSYSTKYLSLALIFQSFEAISKDQHLLV